MPDVEFQRPKLAGGLPASLGELGLDGSGNLQVHNGTAAQTLYSPANPPAGAVASYATQLKLGVGD